MVSDPEFWIPLFAQAGADTLLVHVEATPHIMRAIQLMHAMASKLAWCSILAHH
jgi:ribulose-phosphate 3-epimerase